MPTFINLLRWTNQGVQGAKNTTKRYRESVSVLEKMGVKERSFFWTMGRYDAIFIGDAPDEETATAAALAVASQGNVRTETFRAYSADEMDKILAKLP